MGLNWSDFASGELATNVITPVLIALVTTIVVGAITRSNDKRSRCNNAILDEVKRLIVLIREISDRSEAELLVQLVGNPTISFRNSLQQIGSHTKAIAMQVEILRLYLPPEASIGLEHASYKWHDELFSDPYPIQKKSDALQSHDQRLKEIHIAHIEWQKYLSRFVIECTTGKINLNAN
jgi:hypothetical protein